MIQRGRKSPAKLAAASAVDRRRPRLDPPAFLSTAGRSLFNDIVASCAPNHFVRSDIELLATYVKASLLVRETTGNINQWDRAARLQASLAVRLRLTPSSRLAPATIARRLPEPGDEPFPWETEED